MSDKPANAPATGATLRNDEVLSYWQLAARDFRRRGLAMGALAVVLFVITVAVFAPLIANNRPLAVRMVWDIDYEDAYFIALEAHAKRMAAATEEAKTAENLVLLQALRRMLPHLDGKERDDFVRLMPALLHLHSAPFPVKETTQFVDILEKDFDPAVVTLVPVTDYPAFKTLTRGERLAMLIYVACVAIFLLGRWLPRWKVLAPATIVIVGLGWQAWLVAVPPVQDAMKWRLTLDSEAFQSNADWWAVRALVPYGENENITAEARQPPTFLIAESARAKDQHWHWLGTDTNGRDVLCRMVYGARIAMLVGIVAVSIYVTIGIVLGAVAGYYGGWTDILLSRLTEIVICFPLLFLILSVQAFLQPSMVNIMVALGLFSWTGVARLQRGEFLRIVNLDYVAAVRALGGSDARIIFLHILPNAFAPILVMISFGMAGSILVESSLSFLGFGVPQPTASWGDLLNNGRGDIQGLWWLTLFPGAAIFVAVTCFNLVGDALRDALDPRRG